MLKMITKWINTTDETEEECRSMFDKIEAQLALVEHSRYRSEFGHKQIAEQLEKYKKLHLKMEENINIKKEEIAKQKSELTKAKIIKQNRIQYDLLAKAIAKEPPRTDTNKNLKMLQKQLADLAAEKKHLEQQMDSRKKQFLVLSTSANVLSALLDKENSQTVKSSKENSGTSGSEAMSE